MKKRFKLIALIGIIAMSALSGTLAMTSNRKEAMSEMTRANIEALTSSESTTDCDAYCKEDPNYTCVLHYSWGETYCLRKSARN